MTVHKFRTLTGKQKKTVVLRAGCFLAEQHFGLYRKMLYQVDSFYVEVYFTRFSKKAIWFRAFDATSQLRSYLKQIDISPLLRDVCINN